MSGSMDCVIAAGIDSMTRVPMFTPRELPRCNDMGLFMSPRLQARYPGIEFILFTGAERMAQQYGLAKEALDRFALFSIQRAAAASREGRFDREILSLLVRRANRSDDHERHTVDEGIRFYATLEGIAAVKRIQ